MKKIMMVLACALCANVFAQTQPIGDTTTTWEVNGGVLTIGGTGDMPNWAYANISKRPWNDIRDSITSVIINKGVTRIGVNSFVNCYSLTDITISTSVTSIGELAFGGCSTLRSVMIPSSVTSIDPNVFTSCIALNSIIMNGKTPPKLGSSAFGARFYGTIYVPVGSKDAYANASGWSDYEENIVENVDGPWSIGDGVYACMNDTTLVIEGSGAMNDFASAEEIPWKATEIKKVTIAEGVTKVGARSWEGMSDAVTINGVALSVIKFASTGLNSAESVIPEGMMLVAKEAITAAKATTISIKDNEVKLGVSVKRSDDITAEPMKWEELEPVIITIPVKSKQGFMLLNSREGLFPRPCLNVKE